MRVSLLVCLISMFFILLLPSSGLTQDNQVFGTVGRTSVTLNDVQQRLMRTGGPRAGELLSEAIERTADEMLAELVVERQLSRLPRFDPELSARISLARRQLMMDFYVQTNMERRTPSDDEIDAFIAENPRFFKDRASFWFNQFLFQLPEEDDRNRFDDALNRLRDGELTTQRILDFQSTLLEADIPFQRQSIWRSSEQISAELLDRLETLYASGEMVEMTETDGRGELLLLLQRAADPVDPTVQRQQIVQGFVQRSIAEQRDEMIAELAASVHRGQEEEALEAVEDVMASAGVDLADASDEAPDSGDLLNASSEAATGDIDELEMAEVDEPEYAQDTRARAGMFALLGGVTFLLPLAAWSGGRIPKSMHPGSLRLEQARYGVAAVVLVGVVGSLWVAVRLSPFMGVQSIVALGIGGLVMGGLAAFTWQRNEGRKPLRTTRETTRFAGVVAAQLVLLIAFVAFQFR